MGEPKKDGMVNGFRYKPWALATEALKHTFDMPILTGDVADWNAARRDEFITAMPDWVVADTLHGCRKLIERIHELRPESRDYDGPAVPAPK